MKESTTSITPLVLGDMFRVTNSTFVLAVKITTTDTLVLTRRNPTHPNLAT